VALREGFIFDGGRDGIEMCATCSSSLRNKAGAIHCPTPTNGVEQATKPKKSSKQEKAEGKKQRVA
jgi:hypothetical protein